MLFRERTIGLASSWGIYSSTTTTVALGFDSLELRGHDDKSRSLTVTALLLLRTSCYQGKGNNKGKRWTRSVKLLTTISALALIT